MAAQNIPITYASTEIDATLSRYFKPDLPGAAVIVTKDGKTLFRKAYGMANLELDVPLQASMTFRLGSMTKQFTAAAIMLLVDQGKLSLDDDIGKYLPKFPTRGAHITIEHLLTHTSGIINFVAMPKFATLSKSDVTVEQIIDFFQNEPLEFSAGEKFSYSNSGYFLLGAIIENISGMKYADFMKKNIFSPLQLNNTFYDNSERIVHFRASGYTKNESVIENASFINMAIPFAAGGLTSSVDDLALWHDAIAAEKLLKPESWKRIFTPYTLINGKSTGGGYGWFARKIKGLDILEHDGGIDGFSGNILRIPSEGVFIAILSNNDTQDPYIQTIAENIATMIHP